MNPATPMCPHCGRKFPGDPCSGCGRDRVEAQALKASRMPRVTRRRRKHGRQ